MKYTLSKSVKVITCIAAGFFIAAPTYAQYGGEIPKEVQKVIADKIGAGIVYEDMNIEIICSASQMGFKKTKSGFEEPFSALVPLKKQKNKIHKGSTQDYQFMVAPTLSTPNSFTLSVTHIGSGVMNQTTMSTDSRGRLSTRASLIQKNEQFSYLESDLYCEQNLK